MKQDWKACMKRIMGLYKESGGAAGKDVNQNGSGYGDVPPVGGNLDVPTRVLQPAHTLRLRPEPEPARFPQEELPSSPAHFDWHGMTDKGLVRDHNEDFYSYASLESKALFVIADGMGGHDAGEIASRLAVETVCRVVTEGTKRELDPERLLEHAVQMANAAVKREALNAGSNMGTTLSAVFAVSDAAAYVASVGDSRVYWIENGSIKQVTEDHSLVAKLVAAGKLTKQEARHHPKSNLLYRTVGTDETVKVDTFRVELKKGGSLLLCSDGLWGEVEDEDIYRICSTERTTKAACSRLVQMANDSGGRDNITVVAVRVV